MIDTIAIRFFKNDFIITDYEKFTPSARGLFEPPFYRLGKGGYFSCYQKIKQGQGSKYRPNLTITKRMLGSGYSISLKIQFSAPKLIYGNNFDEVEDNSLETVKKALAASLREMGVNIGAIDFANCEVCEIHYAKNIPFIDGTTSSILISEIGKVNFNSRLDLNKTDYRNGGHAIRFHSNSHEIVFYDKIKDYVQALTSEKRSIEGSKWQQTTLPKNLEIFRIEIRLNTRVKIRALCSHLGITHDLLTFGELFKTDIARKILLHFWDSMANEIQLLGASSCKPLDQYQLMIAKGRTKPLKALQLLGFNQLIGAIGLRGAKLMLGQNYAGLKRSAQNQIKNYPINNDFKARMFLQVRKTLVEFSPVKMHIYKDLQSVGSL